MPAKSSMHHRGICKKDPTSQIHWIRCTCCDGKKHRELASTFAKARAKLEIRQVTEAGSSLANAHLRKDLALGL